MTNFEKYKEQILRILEASDHEIAAVKNGVPVLCDDIECSDCDIRDKSGNGACVSNLIKWLYEDDGADCLPDASKPKGGCKGCHYEGNNILNMPCCHCERAIMDCFEPKKKSEKKPEKKTKTRQDEFLERYPDARMLNGVIDICPKHVDGNCDRCRIYAKRPCIECHKDYWLQEVEE